MNTVAICSVDVAWSKERSTEHTRGYPLKPTTLRGKVMITGVQIRGARGLPGWSRAELSRKRGISESSIQRYEMGQRFSRESTLVAIEAALPEGGVEFIGSVGVQLPANKRIGT
jgi:ribosome-binding protein aMBF1 (putative translation factor)